MEETKVRYSELQNIKLNELCAKKSVTQRNICAAH